MKNCASYKRSIHEVYQTDDIVRLKRYFLVIEGSRVGPFVKISESGNLRQLLGEWGIKIEVSRDNV
jgi:hypothetical protein